MQQNELNIVIRTSGRPNYFKNCINSIRKFAPRAMLHIIVDNTEDREYVEKLAYGLKYWYYNVDKEAVKTICDKIKITRPQFIYNYYFNLVKPYLNGWCLLLDDDDELLHTINIDFVPPNIYLYKVKIGERIVPNKENFGNRPVLNDISGIGIVFHSSQMVDWMPQRGGDFDFITAMYEKNNPVWVDEILSGTQTGGNFGKRNDLKDE